MTRRSAANWWNSSRVGVTTPNPDRAAAVSIRLTMGPIVPTVDRPRPQPHLHALNSLIVEKVAGVSHDDEVSKAVKQEPTRRRGRRPGGADTRAALVEAARTVFIEQGYDGATVRSIAALAGVDAAMVNHWFGGKEGLFAEAVLKLPFNPKDIADQLLDGDVDDLGERIVRTFLTTWDNTGGGVFTALMRSITSHDQAAHVLRDL